MYANLTPTLELDAGQNELREDPLIKLDRSQEIPQVERSRHNLKYRGNLKTVQVQSFVMNHGRDTPQKQLARQYTPQEKVKVATLDQLRILIFKPVEERLVGI